MILVKMKDTAEAYLGKVLGEWQLVATPLYVGVTLYRMQVVLSVQVECFYFLLASAKHDRKKHFRFWL